MPEQPHLTIAPEPDDRKRWIIVDAQTGEAVGETDEHPDDLKADVAMAKQAAKSWHGKWLALQDDRERKMRDHAALPVVREIFDYWRRACKHPASEFGPDRFFLIEPYLRKYGPDLCKRAIDGAAFDPFITKRANGSPKRHDGLDLIFRSAEKFEEFCNRAPRKKEET